MSTDIHTDYNFKLALERAHKIPKVPKNYGTLLDIYGLKQSAEVGKINKERPRSINLRGTLKWDAWKKWEHSNSEDAKREVAKIVARWMLDNPNCNLH